MPSWAVHRDVASLLRLDVELCSTIDRLVDSKRPTIAEIVEHLDKLYQALGKALGVNLEDHGASSGEYSVVYLGHDYGCNPSEFPLMYSYVYERYGVAGCACMVLHCVLDYVAQLLRKGYARDLVLRNVLQLLDMYRHECISLGMCRDCDSVLNLVESRVVEKFDDVVAIVEVYVRKKLDDASRVVNALSEVLDKHLKLLIFLKGYRGKHGFSIGMEGQRTFMKLLPRAKRLLYEKLCELAMREDLDIGNITEAVNSFRRLRPRTVSDTYRHLRTLALSNRDFAIALYLVYQTVKELESQIPRKET